MRRAFYQRLHCAVDNSQVHCSDLRVVIVRLRLLGKKVQVRHPPKTLHCQLAYCVPVDLLLGIHCNHLIRDGLKKFAGFGQVSGVRAVALAAPKFVPRLPYLAAAARAFSAWGCTSITTLPLCIETLAASNIAPDAFDTASFTGSSCNRL